MFRLPKDIENELIHKYPHVDVVNLFHDTITLMVQKSCFDGLCSIREFGKFLAFKVFSSRLGKETIRFKFKHSISFLNRLKNDKYIIENLAIKAPVPFTDEHEKKCKPNRNKRVDATNFLAQAHKNTKEKTNYRVATQEILKILETSDDKLDES